MGKELAFALGINITFARGGSALGGFVFPGFYNLAKDDKLFWALFAGFWFCVLSIICGIVLNIMDKIADK